MDVRSLWQGESVNVETHAESTKIVAPTKKSTARRQLLLQARARTWVVMVTLIRGKPANAQKPAETSEIVAMIIKRSASLDSLYQPDGFYMSMRTS